MVHFRSNPYESLRLVYRTYIWNHLSSNVLLIKTLKNLGGSQGIISTAVTAHSLQPNFWDWGQSCFSVQHHLTLQTRLVEA